MTLSNQGEKKDVSCPLLAIRGGVASRGMRCDGYGSYAGAMCGIRRSGRGYRRDESWCIDDAGGCAFGWIARVASGARRNEVGGPVRAGFVSYGRRRRA